MSRRIGVICCAGDLPKQVIAGIRAAGDEVAAIAISGFAGDIGVEKPFVASIGQVGRMFDFFRSQTVAGVLMVGSLVRPDLASLRIDWGVVKALPSLAQALRGGDAALLHAVVSFIEREGFPVLGVADVAPSMVIGEGNLARTQPTRHDLGDIRSGFDCLRALSPFDIGQALVIVEGRVIAIEAAEGTDLMLERVADLRASGRLKLPARCGVLVKSAKDGQDLRVDMPTIGPRTIALATAAGLNGLALGAHDVLLLHRARLVADADAAGLFICGYERER